MGIIKSILDTDLYKLSMAWVVMQKYPEYEVKYQFQNRGKTKFREGFGEELKKEIKLLSNLSLTKEEEDYLRNTPSLSFIPELFIQWLKGYRYNPNEVLITQIDRAQDNLEIEVSGHWFRTIMWETTILSLVSELNFNDVGVYLGKVTDRAKQKGLHFHLNGQKIAEMGTRRRLSYDVQDASIKGLCSYIVGTSNVHFAMKYNLKPLGTMAHEYISFHGALYGYEMANKISSEVWLEVYKNGDVGTYLPDTFGISSFLKTFDYKMATLFSGLRHDSGDPFIFGEKVNKKYKELNVDSKLKTFIFSNGLSSHEEIDEIHNHFQGTNLVSFGVGTWITNDIDGVDPLKIVMKMVKVKINNKWVDVIKLSDDEGKHSGDIEEVRRAKITLGIDLV